MKKGSLKKYILPNMPYLFMAWACLKLGTAYQLAAGANVGQKLVGIAEKTVLSLVSDMLQAISDYAKSDRAAFIREVQEAQASQQDSDIRKKRRRLAAAQKRAGELELHPFSWTLWNRNVIMVFEERGAVQLWTEKGRNIESTQWKRNCSF